MVYGIPIGFIMWKSGFTVWFRCERSLKNTLLPSERVEKARVSLSKLRDAWLKLITGS